MPPTVVIPGGTLLELIEPTAHIYWSTVYGRYDHRPLVGFTHGTSEAEVQSRMVHGTIKVLLPIETNGTIREYLFQFSVKGSVVPGGWAS